MQDPRLLTSPLQTLYKPGDDLSHSTTSALLFHSSTTCHVPCKLRNEAPPLGVAHPDSLGVFISICVRWSEYQYFVGHTYIAMYSETGEEQWAAWDQIQIFISVLVYNRVRILHLIVVETRALRGNPQGEQGEHAKSTRKGPANLGTEPWTFFAVRQQY